MARPAGRARHPDVVGDGREHAGSQHYSAVLTFIDQHADRPLAGQNPMGVWVSDFQPTLIEERR